MTKIRVLCQYCGHLMGIIDGFGTSGTSHGICEDCAPLNEWQQMALYAARMAMELR